MQKSTAGAPDVIWIIPDATKAQTSGARRGSTPRPRSPNISQPSVVTTTVFSSLMKPRRGWSIVVSTGSTMPASTWPQAVNAGTITPYRSSVDPRAPSDFFVLKTISRQQNERERSREPVGLGLQSARDF